MPKQLAEAEVFPEGLEYIWKYFIELHSETPLSYSEIKSWSTLIYPDILAWEVELLRTLDVVYRR